MGAVGLTLIIFPAMAFRESYAHSNRYVVTPDLRWDSLLFHAVWRTVTREPLVALIDFARRHLHRPSPRLAAA